MSDMQTASTIKSEVMLEGFIDFAGLYPPANLDMQATVDNWASFLKSEDSWMLARLIIPANRLDEFKECATDLLPTLEEEMWQLSVLLPQQVVTHLKRQYKQPIDFNIESCGAVANVVEFKATTTEEIDFALSILHDDLFPFIELPIEEDPRGLIACLSGSIAGAKVRTGGITPDLYPASQFAC